MWNREENNNNERNINEENKHEKINEESKHKDIISKTKRRKKVRRSKKKKNILRKTKIMMVNIRGIQSKIETLKSIIEEEEPTILILMETMSNEEQDIPGYKSKVMNTREDGWGGIMIIAKTEISNLIQVKREERKEAEMIFVQVTCGRNNMTIGIIYAPQENQVNKQQVNEMYETIEEEIQKAKDEKQVVMIVGDLNCKVGEIIKGNRKEVTKGGRRLIKLKDEMDMTIMNAEDNCKGLWTRIQKETRSIKKSVIDYVLITEEHRSIIEKMEIDEEKEITPYRDDTKFKKERKYTDHNMITLQMNLDIRREVKEERIVVNEKNMEKFKMETETGHYNEIWEDKQLTTQEKYTKWNQEVITTAKKICKQKQKQKTEMKETKILRQQRKRLKKQIQKEKKKRIRKIIKRRRLMIKDHIVKIKEEEKYDKVTGVAESILKKGMFNPNAYWEFRRKMKSKKGIEGKSINDSEGKREDNPEKIKKIYRDYFEELLKIKEAQTETEKETEEIINRCIEAMREIAEKEPIQEVTKKEYEEMKSKLKKQKSTR